MSRIEKDIRVDLDYPYHNIDQAILPRQIYAGEIRIEDDGSYVQTQTFSSVPPLNFNNGRFTGNEENIGTNGSSRTQMTVLVDTQGRTKQRIRQIDHLRSQEFPVLNKNTGLDHSSSQPAGISFAEKIRLETENISQKTGGEHTNRKRRVENKRYVNGSFSGKRIYESHDKRDYEQEQVKFESGHQIFVNASAESSQNSKKTQKALQNAAIESEMRDEIYESPSRQNDGSRSKRSQHIMDKTPNEPQKKGQLLAISSKNLSKLASTVVLINSDSLVTLKQIEKQKIQDDKLHYSNQISKETSYINPNSSTQLKIQQDVNGKLIAFSQASKTGQSTNVFQTKRDVNIFEQKEPSIKPETGRNAKDIIEARKEVQKKPHHRQRETKFQTAQETPVMLNSKRMPNANNATIRHSSDENRVNQIISQVRIISSDVSNLNEQELISAKSPTAQDYMADISGSRRHIKDSKMLEQSMIEESRNDQHVDQHDSDFQPSSFPNSQTSRGIRQTQNHHQVLPYNTGYKERVASEGELEVKALVNFIINQVDEKIDQIEKDKLKEAQEERDRHMKSMIKDDSIQDIVANHLANEDLNSETEINESEDQGQQSHRYVTNEPDHSCTVRGIATFKGSKNATPQDMSTVPTQRRENHFLQNSLNLATIEANIVDKVPPKVFYLPASIDQNPYLHPGSRQVNGKQRIHSYDFELERITELKRESGEKTTYKGLSHRNESQSNKNIETNPNLTTSLNQLSSVYTIHDVEKNRELKPKRGSVRKIKKSIETTSIWKNQQQFQHHSLEGQRLQTQSLDSEGQRLIQQDIIRERLKKLRQINNNRPPPDNIMRQIKRQSYAQDQEANRFRQEQQNREDEANMTNMRESIQVSERFDLRDFIMRADSHGIFNMKPKSIPQQVSSLPIHKFHKQNKNQGKFKNQGPIQWPAQSRFQQMQNSDYFNTIRDPKIKAAIKNTKQMLAASMDTGHHSLQIPPFDQPKASVDLQLESRKKVNSFNNFVRDEALPQLFDEQGELDIEKAFALTQLIGQAHGINPLSNDEILSRLPSRAESNGQSMQERLAAFKWIQVMRFMKKNPHILRQLVALKEKNEIHQEQKEQWQRAQNEIQFYSSRIKVTDKILASLRNDLGHPRVFKNNKIVGGQSVDSKFIHQIQKQAERRKLNQIEQQREFNAKKNKQTVMGTFQQFKTLEKQRKSKDSSISIIKQPKLSFHHSNSPPINRHKNCGADLNTLQLPKSSQTQSRQTGPKNSIRAKIAASSFSPVSRRKISQPARDTQPYQSVKETAGLALVMRRRRDNEQIYDQRYMQNEEREVSPNFQTVEIPDEPQIPRGLSGYMNLNKTQVQENRQFSKVQVTKQRIFSSNQPAPQYFSDTSKNNQRNARQNATEENQPNAENINSYNESTQNGLSPGTKKFLQQQLSNPQIINDTNSNIVNQKFNIYNTNEHQNIRLKSNPPQDLKQKQGIQTAVNNNNYYQVEKEEDRMDHSMDITSKAGIMNINNSIKFQRQQVAKSQYGATSPFPQDNENRYFDAKSQHYQASPMEPFRSRGLNQKTESQMMEKHRVISGIARHPMKEEEIELTSLKSFPHSRFDELSMQMKNLEIEENEINNQRKKILIEKEKIARILKKVDAKEKFFEREDKVRQQREALDMEKEKLKEEIAELDNLKNILVSKKNETHTGFEELAESNKEVISMKSGDLLSKERSGLSRGSQRSKFLVRTTIMQSSGTGSGTVNGLNLKHIESETGKEYQNKTLNRPAQFSGKQSNRANKIQPVESPMSKTQNNFRIIYPAQGNVHEEIEDNMNDGSQVKYENSARESQ